MRVHFFVLYSKYTQCVWMVLEHTSCLSSFLFDVTVLYWSVIGVCCCCRRLLLFCWQWWTCGWTLSNKWRVRDRNSLNELNHHKMNHQSIDWVDRQKINCQLFWEVNVWFYFSNRNAKNAPVPVFLYLHCCHKTTDPSRVPYPPFVGWLENIHNQRC